MVHHLHFQRISVLLEVCHVYGSGGTMIDSANNHFHDLTRIFSDGYEFISVAICGLRNNWKIRRKEIISCFTNAAFKISRANAAASPIAGNGTNLDASLSSFKVCPPMTAASSTVFMIGQFTGFVMKGMTIRPWAEYILVEERKNNSAQNPPQVDFNICSCEMTKIACAISKYKTLHKHYIMLSNYHDPFRQHIDHLLASYAQAHLIKDHREYTFCVAQLVGFSEIYNHSGCRISGSSWSPTSWNQYL